MPVLLQPSGQSSANVGIHASLHRDGMTITLRVLQYTYFSFDETEVVAMPVHSSEARWQLLVGRRYATFASAAQETHVLVFGTRCDYMRAFYVYCVPLAVDPRLPVTVDFGNDRSSNILAVAPHIEAHAHSRFEVRPFADGTPTASWRPIGSLRPAISLERTSGAITELDAMAASARAEEERKAAMRVAGYIVHPSKPPGYTRNPASGKRPREERQETGQDASSCSSSSSHLRAKQPKYRLSDKPGMIVWERDLEAALAAQRAPVAYVVRNSRKEEPREVGGSPKVLLVEPLPVGSRAASWIHASELASMEEHLPRIWHDMRALCANAALRAAIETAAEHAFTEHHRDHASFLTGEALWNRLMRTAGKPVGAPPSLSYTGS